MNNRYIAPILLSLILTALPCMAQNNPATNNVPKVEKPDPEDDKCECGCDYASQVRVESISFIQSFGQSPWISGAPKGRIRIQESAPSEKLGTRAMLCYDHPLSSRVIRRDSGTGEITVADGLGRETVYDRNGKPKLTAYGRNRQCLLKAGGEAHELLMDRTRIVYDTFNTPVRIVTPDGVEVPASDLGIVVVKDMGGLRQIWSKVDGLLDMTEPALGTVLVSWYAPSVVSQQAGQNGLYTVSGNASKTFTFRYTVIHGFVEDVNRLVFEERRGNDFLFTYEWNYLPSQGAWTMYRGEGQEQVTESIVRPPQIYPGRILQTRTKTSGGGTASITKELYSFDYLGYRLLNKTAVNPDGSEQVLYSVARIDQGANAGRFSAITNAYGGLESYIYDSDGRMTRKTETVFGNITQVTSNQFVSARDANGFVDRRPIRSIVTQNGVVVSDTTYTYRSSFSIFGSTVLGLCDTAIRTDPKTGVTLRSYTHYYSATSANAIERGRVRLTVNPDGTATHYAYAAGENDSWTETVTQGYYRPAFVENGQSFQPPTDLDQLFDVLHGKTTQTVVTHDFRGDVVRTDSYVHIGTGFALAGWETHTYNLMHKRLGTTRHDGTSDSSNWICTGPVWQRNADGTSVTNTFDTAKRIKTSTRYTPFGNVTKTYTYNADNQVVSVTTATNGVTVGCGIGCGSTYSEFDTQGRTILSVDAIGRTNRTSYSLDNRTVTHTDPAGAVVVENYGTDGSLLSRTGTVMRAEYYTKGVDSTTGTRWEKTTYGSTTGPDYTKSYYNALSQLVLQERPGFGGAILKIVYAYNTKGQLESETRLVQGGTGTYDLPVTTYAYNQLGDRTSTTKTSGDISRIQSSDSAFVLDNGIVQQTSISVQSCSDVTIPAMTNSAITRLYPLENGLLAESRQRDVRGNETVQTVTRNPTTLVTTTTVTSTASTLPATSTSLAGLTLSSTDPHGCTTTYTYDALMRQISAETRSGPNNERLTGNYTHFNVIGQVDYTEDAFGSRTFYGYEPGTGRNISITQVPPPPSLLPPTSVQTAFDQAGRTVATWGATYPVAYEYDTAGRMIAMYTYRGTNAIASYSDIVALKTEMDRTQWLYDQATGLLTNKLYADGKGPSYSYTARGQLSTRKWARLSTDNCPLITDYFYNSFGSLTNTANSDGTPSIAFTYTALGQMKTISDASDGQMIAEALAFNTSLFTVHEKFDNLGRNQGYALSNNVGLITGTMQSFDIYGRLNQVAVDGISGAFIYGYLEGTHLQKTLAMNNGVTRTFGYESNRDLLTSIIHSNATERLVQRDFTFDGLGRLSNRTLFRANETPVNPDAFGYNLRSELTNAVIGANAFAYDFDPIGNRKEATEFGTNTSYTASALNQYTSINPINPVNPVENFTPEFDLDGNQTLLKTTTGIWHVTYNAENRPILFSNETTVVEMTYDYMGRRFEYKETVADTLDRHERYLYRGYLQIIIAWDPTEPSATRPLSLQIGGNAYYYCFDQVKNVTQLIDSDGALAATYDYSPFGQVIASTGTIANPITFSSEIHDSTLGLQYYNYRHLNTLDGRWVTRDPIGENAGRNLYVASANRLSCLWDYLGLKNISEKSSVPAKCTIVIIVGHGKVKLSKPISTVLNNEYYGVIDDVLIDSAIGRGAQKYADLGYGGIGMSGCWSAQTLENINKKRALTPEKTPIPWVHPITDYVEGVSQTSVTWRKTDGLFEDKQPGPSENTHDGPIGTTYGMHPHKPRSFADIQNQLNMDITSKMLCLCKEGCKEVRIVYIDENGKIQVLVNSGKDGKTGKYNDETRPCPEIPQEAE
jgi:RHS repeat-associated protein